MEWSCPELLSALLEGAKEARRVGVVNAIKSCFLGGQQDLEWVRAGPDKTKIDYRYKTRVQAAGGSRRVASFLVWRARRCAVAVVGQVKSSGWRQ